MDFWFDDPVFDNAEEEFGGKLFVGDEWRTLQYWKEVNGMCDLIRVAGTSFKATGVMKAVQSSSRETTLQPEPSNPHDREAVKVLVGGEEVGYVPRGKRVPPQARVSVFRMGLAPQPHVWLAVGAS